MPVATSRCLVLPEFIDEQHFMAVTSLDILLPPLPGSAGSTVLNAKVLRVDPLVSPSGGAAFATAEVEVEILSGSRLLVACQRVVLRAERRLRGTCGSRVVVRSAELDLFRQQMGAAPRPEQHLLLAGSSAGDQFGFAVALVGDLDGDGIADLAIGAPSTAAGGSLYLMSSATGSLLRRIDGGIPEGSFGFAVTPAGDVDGDGTPDILVGAPGPHDLLGHAYLISGRTGSILRTYTGSSNGDQFGWSVANPGDVDGDGIPDQAIGAPSAAPGGRVDAGSAYLFSGATGALINRWDGADPGDALGFAVAGVGDSNSDGFPEMLIGASQASPAGVEQAGLALLVTTRPPFSVLHTFVGSNAGDGLGWLVASAGDVNGDGVPDLMIGSPGTAPFGGALPGRLSFYSGATFSKLSELDGTSQGDSFGLAAAAANLGTGPFQLVGVPDAGPILSTGRADLFFGASAPPVRTFSGRDRFSQFGWAVAMDGGQSVLAIGAPGANPGGLQAAGTVDVFILAGPDHLHLELCVEALLATEESRQVTLSSSSGACTGGSGTPGIGDTRW